MGSHVPRVFVLALVAGVVIAPASVTAQSPALRDARDSLRSYDLEGSRTLDVIEELGWASRAIRREEARLEARFLRASAALDLLIASSLGAAPSMEPARIARALGIHEDAIARHLRDELDVVAARGADRELVREALSALDLRDAVSRFGPAAVDWSRYDGARRDLWLALHASDALGISGDPAKLPPAIAPDPCALPSSPCEEPWSALATSSRRELAAMLEVGSAIRRVRQRAWDGDALCRALADRVHLANARLETTVLRPVPRLVRDRDLAGGDDAEPVRAGVLVLVRRREVRIASVPPLRVRDGQIVTSADAEHVHPDASSVPLPWRLGGPVRPIVELSRALGAHRPERQTVAVAVAPRVPTHVLERVIASVAEIARGPIALVRRASDGTLRGAPVAMVMRGRDVSRRDLVVHLLSGRYALHRRHRRITLRLPRVRPHPPDGVGLARLDTLFERLPHRRVVLRARHDVPARDVLDTAFRAIAAGEQVALRVR